MSVRQDEPMKFKAALFEWYAMGYRYPILKVIEASIKKGKRKVLEHSFAYAANVEGMSHLEDEQNKELKDKMRGISLESNTKHRPLPRMTFLRSRYLMPLATKPSQRSHITMA